MVVPRRHQLGGRDVVVVDDERPGPSGQPRGHRRGGGELVDDDVALLGRLGIGEDGHRLPRRLGVDRVDVDLRGEATGPRRIAQAQGVSPDRVTAMQHGDEVVDAPHEGVTAVRANRRSLPTSASSGATSTKPARSNSSSQVASCSGRPCTRSSAGASHAPVAAAGSATTTSGASRPRVRRHCARTESRACSGRRSTTPLDRDAPERPLRPAGQVLGRLGDGDGQAAFERPQGRGAARLHPVRHRAPAGQLVEEVALAAVGVDQVAPGGARQEVRRHRPGPGSEGAGRDQPGGALHRPVLRGQPCLERGDAGRQEAEGLDHVAHRLGELVRGALGRRRGPIPATAQPAEAARPPAAGAALVLERIRQRRGARVVRAVAVTEMGERRKEIPLVAALGCQAREGGAQGLRRPFPVLGRRGAGNVVTVLAVCSIGIAGWGLRSGHGGRCYRRCPSAVGGCGPEEGRQRLPSRG